MAELAQAYIAQGKGGLTKVGYTKRPVARVKLLRKEFVAKGDELDSFEPFEPSYYAWWVERKLIGFCRENFNRHSGFEWFTGCDMQAVRAVAIECTLARKGEVPPTPIPHTAEQIAAWATERAQREEARRIRKLAVQAEGLRRSAAFQLKRRRPEYVIAAIVAFALAQRPISPTPAEARHG